MFCSVWRRYGVGQIEYRQEKFELAAFNFKCALNVRPHLSNIADLEQTIAPHSMTHPSWNNSLLRISLKLLHVASSGFFPSTLLAKNVCRLEPCMLCLYLWQMANC